MGTSDYYCMCLTCRSGLQWHFNYNNMCYSCLFIHGGHAGDFRLYLNTLLVWEVHNGKGDCAVCMYCYTFTVFIINLWLIYNFLVPVDSLAFGWIVWFIKDQLECYRCYSMTFFSLQAGWIWGERIIVDMLYPPYKMLLEYNMCLLLYHAWVYMPYLNHTSQ
jgi:hypothetical protein